MLILLLLMAASLLAVALFKTGGSRSTAFSYCRIDRSHPHQKPNE
ncbi:MAG TPA: hypothetical protein V6C52_08765 [Coleofasciculaceae cyanobacterium]